MLSCECHSTSLMRINIGLGNGLVTSSKAARRCLSQCWPRSLLPCDVTRPQWGNLYPSELLHWPCQCSKLIPFSSLLITISYAAHVIKQNDYVIKLSNCQLIEMWTWVTWVTLSRESILSDDMTTTNQSTTPSAYFYWCPAFLNVSRRCSP